MLAEGKTLLLRSAIFVGLASVVTTIIYLTPVPEIDFTSCERPCSEFEWPMICRIKLTLESYQTLSRSCGDCPVNSTDCDRRYCVPADGSRRKILTANRHLPGPAIQVCQNDVLLVDVVNRIPGRELGVHWRGQPQEDSPHMDGVPGVTQCAMGSHTTFQYRFRASRAGTHLWHAVGGPHVSEGLFGALVVRSPGGRDPQQGEYDEDSPRHVVVINQWGKEEDPGRVLLVNGRGREEGAETPVPLAIFSVSHGRRYRFRLAYVGQGCPVQVSVDGHVLRLIALDGYPVQPREVSSVVLSGGERVDVVVTADRADSTYRLRAVTVEGCGIPAEGVGLVQYEGAAGEEELQDNTVDGQGPPAGVQFLNTFRPDCGTPDSSAVCLTNFRSAVEAPDVLVRKDVDTRVYLAFGRRKIPDNVTSDAFPDASSLPTVNGVTFLWPSAPLLSQPKQTPAVCDATKCSEDAALCECVHVIDVRKGASVELVLVDQDGSPRQLVFHLHGYRFHVAGLSQLPGPLSVDQAKTLDAENKLLERSLERPVARDTITLPPRGVAALRFVADNPGYWLLNDDQSFFWGGGYNVVLRVGQPADMPPPPEDFPTCGDWIGPEFFLI